MKKSKKIISVILTLIMAFGTVSVGVYALDPEQYIPTIIIPGVFQSDVHYYENGEIAVNSEGKEYSKPFFISETKDIVAAALVEALIPISKLLISQEDKDGKAAAALSDVLCNVLMEKNKCDENGKFIHDIRATKYNTSVAGMSAEDRAYVLNQIPLQSYIDIAGEENLYFFSYASLGNMIDTATELYDYIQFVKADSGSEKVNIVPISQGGSIANGLMQIYADNGISMANDIHRMIFVVPALDGTILIGEIYQYGILDDSDELYSKMFPALLGDDDYLSYLINVLIRIIPNADLNAILDKVSETLIMDYTRFSTLMWAFVPSGNYEACREMYLSDEKTQNILPQADWFYGAQLNSDANILKAVEDGVEVFDIVDYNYSLYEIVDSWDDVNGDGIIQLDSTSMGAYSLGVDVQLPDDYTRSVDNCSDPEHHNHADPNNIVDARTGLLPETTFYFCNQDHEKTANNDVIMKLASALLTDNSFTSVYSYPDKFPQFNYCRNSKNLIKDVKEMKAYNTSACPASDVAELNAAIAQVDAVIENTVVDTAAFEAASARFYAAREKILNPNPTEPTQDDNSIDIKAILLKLFKSLSDFLFGKFGGDGFSDMTK